MISLVLWEMYTSINIITPDDFKILIPRIIASFFMHANLQGEIKNGMDTMKYVANHPYSFRKFDPSHDEADSDDDQDQTEEELNDGLYIRVFYAFMLGFLQTAMGLVLEVMSILYLCSKDSFRLILMSYATMAAIASFDDLYAKSLLEHPIRGVVGKKIRVVYRRCFLFEGNNIRKAITIDRQGESDLQAKSVGAGDRAALMAMVDEGAGGGGGGGGQSGATGGGGGGTGGGGGGGADSTPAAGGGHDSQAAEGGQRFISDEHDKMLASMDSESPRNACFFKVLRFIQKLIRIFYMSFFFYFAPFGMLLYQFYLNQSARVGAATSD